MTGILRKTLLPLLFIVLSSFTLASEEAKRIPTGVSLIKEWTPDQHLYVTGEVNLTAAELNALEKWLDQNGPNWTVLLSQSSQNERYRGAFGENLTKVDAVENAIERGLPAKTKFGQLRDQKTKLLNGATFTIFLQERQLSYFGSEQYSRNGAAPSRFKNDLDAQARKALRNGNRIIDAVKGTVTSIDARVNATITKREQTKVAQAQSNQRRVDALRSHFVLVSEKHSVILSTLEEPNGDFSRFPVQKLREQIDSIEKNPSRHDLETAQANLDRWDSWIEHFKKDRHAFASLEKELSELAPTSAKGKANHKTAQAQLKKAKTDYQVGNFSYLQSLINAKNSRTMVHLEERAARKSKEQRSNTIKVGAATGAGGLCLLGVIGNRRRRRIKAEAEKLLASRKLEMKKTEDRLFELMDRSAVIVGPFNELETRGYTGDTLTLSKQALKHIDEAFVLSSNVQKIIEEGEELIKPGNPLSRSRNVVSGGRYEEAVDLLDAELNVGRQNVPDLKQRTRPGEEVDDTFSVPIDEWENRTTMALTSATECLDRVEEAWSTIIARRKALENNIETLTARQDEIQVDEWLRAELLFEEWIPAITDAETQASETGKTDPVRALDGDMAKGDRMASEAKDLLDLLSNFRDTHWENLEQGEATLDQRKRATVWVDNTLIEHGRAADRIASNSPDGAVSDLISELDSNLEALAKRVADGATLIVRADDAALPAMTSTEQMVSEARREIATNLQLTPEEILIEEEHNPSNFLSKASRQHTAALAALDLGDVTSAEGFLNEVDVLTTHASNLVTRSKEALSNYHETSEALWTRRGALDERGGQLIKETEAMRVRYSPRALFLAPEAPERGTFADSPTRLESDLKAITSRLDRAKTRYQAGGLLESWDLLLAGQDLAKGGEELCANVTTRFQTLARMEEDNATKHESQLRAHTDLREPVRDRRVTQETIQLFELIGTKLSEALSEIEAGDGRRDPYLVEDQLNDLSKRLPILRKTIEGDLEQHDRTLQLFETVKRNQQEAKGLWKTADTDHIPNSAKTNEAMNEIEKCHGNLEDSHRELQIDHADWRKIQTDLRAIHLSLSEAVIDLKNELKLARETVRALEAATREVRKASRWSGSYGIRVTGDHGGRSLATANEVMQRGRYPEALHLAGQARNKARSAIAQAEAREAQKRRAEQAARRRRQQAASRSSRSSFGSSGIQRSSFSSSSRSSSSGRSSFSSRSGAGRSSW